MAKCPHCGRNIGALNAMTSLANERGAQWPVVVYSCPMIACSKVISVQADPFHVNDDLKTKLTKR